MPDIRYIKKAKRADRIARWLISAGGVAIIISVVAILLLILRVALPLYAPSNASQLAQWDVRFSEGGSQRAVAVWVDEYLDTAFALGDKGHLLRFFGKGEQSPIEHALGLPGNGAGRILQAQYLGASQLSLLMDDGEVLFVRIGMPPGRASADSELPVPSVVLIGKLPPPPRPALAIGFQTRILPNGGHLAIRLIEGNRILIDREQINRDIFDNEERRATRSELVVSAPGAIASLAMDGAGRMLYGGMSSGLIIRWEISVEGQAIFREQVRASPETSSVTALCLVHGDISLAVGDETGHVSTWFDAPAEGAPEGKKLRLIHSLKSHNAPIRYLAPSPRGKSVMSVSAEGGLHIDYMTSKQTLLSIRDASGFQLAEFAPRNNGLVALNGENRLFLWRMDSAHPETSWRTLFGKVWYESHKEPAYVWQSSSGSDDYEPKLSLMPLIFGSLKGTLYAMLFSIPLALAGAIYTSQFTSFRFRAAIKPSIEVMAAIPSVVIGFLIALWLGPVVEKFIVAFLFFALAFPVVFLLFLGLWQLIRPLPWIKRHERGHEFLIGIPVVLAAGALSWFLGPYVEALLFDGNFQQWLFGNWGERYDQRNCIIVAFGLGFAVIPIIFTIAEDALSNVPYSMYVASLALGASRWQTVWRVILPSASPGIFAAIMIGFGRAVGETMIVLMATGNTPIMDWSPFNGMRTLSANIAVEIPEAPLNGTLYRVLFLSAVLLFALTFIVNTAAELIRQSLRKKYGQYQ